QSGLVFRRPTASRAPERARLACQRLRRRGASRLRGNAKSPRFSRPRTGRLSVGSGKSGARSRPAHGAGAVAGARSDRRPTYGSRMSDLTYEDLDEVEERVAAHQGAKQRHARDPRLGWLCKCTTDGRGTPLPNLANAMIALRS